MSPQKAVRFWLAALVPTVLGLSFSARAGFCQAGDITISFVSDTTWEVSHMNPDESLGVPLGHAVCICSVEGWGCFWQALQGISATIPGSCEIWAPGISSGSVADLQGAYFERQFVVAGVPTSGEIRVAVDDFAEVSVNGSVVGTTGSITDGGSALQAQRSLRAFNLTPFLVSGTNTITVRAQNGPYSFSAVGCSPCNYTANPAGLVFVGSLSYIGAVPTRPRSWGTLKVLYR